MNNLRLTALGCSLALILPLTVLAVGVFSDVPDAYPYKAEIESLYRAGVVTGNPGGTFAPDRTINRAELLKLLYKATNRTPATTAHGCFVDVDAGSWYESFVCDAASATNQFVQGYSDGKFRPGSPVTRTEALKMVFTVFGLSAPDVSADDRDVVKFVDISVAAWYTKYVSAAYKLGILPIAGDSGTRFYPDKELLRGEAAAYIFNALRSKGAIPSSSSSSVALSSSQSSTASSQSSLPSSIIKNVVFPFDDSGQFQKKIPIVYLFSLTAVKTVVSVQVSTSGYYASDVTCRFYRLDADGFSSEYYLGVPGANSCAIKAAVPNGSYQLQIQPAVADVPYATHVTTAAGDGNDGFVEAVSLSFGRPVTAVLDAGDLYDWYTFTVSDQQSRTVDLSAMEKLTCIIYTPSSVDQYGFKGPECGTPYQYQPGATYTVGIGRIGGDPAVKIPYTVLWK